MIEASANETLLECKQKEYKGYNKKSNMWVKYKLNKEKDYLKLDERNKKIFKKLHNRTHYAAQGPDIDWGTEFIIWKNDYTFDDSSEKSELNRFTGELKIITLEGENSWLRRDHGISRLSYRYICKEIKRKF